MKQQILNYTVIIKPDRRTGTNEPCYSVSCPTLGLADDGNTIEEALRNMKAMIKFDIECLTEEGEEVPLPDHPESMISMASVSIQGTPKFAAF